MDIQIILATLAFALACITVVAWGTRRMLHIVSRPSLVALVGEQGTVRPAVVMLDEIVHDAHHPVCGDPECPCQSEKSQPCSMELNHNSTI